MSMTSLGNLLNFAQIQQQGALSLPRVNISGTVKHKNAKLGLVVFGLI